MKTFSSGIHKVGRVGQEDMLNHVCKVLIISGNALSQLWGHLIIKIKEV